MVPPYPYNGTFLLPSALWRAGREYSPDYPNSECSPGLILRPGEIGEIAIGCDAPMMGRNPGKAQIYAVFILHIAPLGKAVAEENSNGQNRTCEEP